MPREEPIEGETGGVLNPEFEVEGRPLQYTRAPGNYTSPPRPSCISQTSVDEIALYFWRTGLRPTEIL